MSKPFALSPVPTDDTLAAYEITRAEGWYALGLQAQSQVERERAEFNIRAALEHAEQLGDEPYDQESAFQPATGEAFTAPYAGRTTANWVDFLERVDTWLPAEADPVYAIVDNLSTHSAPDVLLFSLAHPRWEFVFQPTYAAYLNLIEPWWKVLRSLALKGRRFETWDQVCLAIDEATRYWNAHRHPFVWG